MAARTEPAGRPARPTRRLFGTDGVRGVAGEFLTADLALALGRAAAAISPAEAPQVVIVRDTRESGEMLEASIAAGVAAAGGHALLAGVLPTPGASLVVPTGSSVGNRRVTGRGWQGPEPSRCQSIGEHRGRRQPRRGAAETGRANGRDHP